MMNYEYGEDNDDDENEGNEEQDKTTKEQERVSKEWIWGLEGSSSCQYYP